MALALYGKHPGRGDFVSQGVPPAILRGLESWLDRALADCRADLGGQWEALWSAAPVLRFWLGEDVLGQAVCGVMAASQDKVGRRFPLLLMAVAEDPAALPPPPSIDPDQGWHDQAAGLLLTLLAQADIGSAPDSPAWAGGTAPAPGPADFWAVQAPGAGMAALWADVALTDHRRAAAGRSYWWVAPPQPVVGPATVSVPGADGEDAEPSPFDLPAPADLLWPDPAPQPGLATPWAQVHAGPGLPSGLVLAWFLRGYTGHG